MSDYRLGLFEELVLLSIARLDAAYAVTIQNCIEETAGRSATMGAVYTALERLEAKGCIRSWLGDSTPQRGGRRKRFYALTGEGVEVLHEVRRMRERMWHGLEGTLSWNPS